MSTLRASVIVTTYNRPKALEIVLQALQAQRRIDFEVIVADDGSGPETRQTVDRASPAFGDRLHWLWHEDRGFRAAAARNRAIERASGERLCFLDGDCIPRPGFVDGHLRLARPDTILRGSRLLLSPGLTRACECGEVSPPHTWHHQTLWKCMCEGDLNRIVPAIGGPVDRIRMVGVALRGRNWRLLRGCNFSVDAAAVRAIGGFDESYEGWGYEDSDLCVRLLNHGLRIRQAPADTCVFHLWHAEQDRTGETTNMARFRQTEESGRVAALRGLTISARALQPTD